MPEFLPVLTMADDMTLDVDEVTAGYQYALQGMPSPVASIFSRSFVHGWHAGRLDVTGAGPSADQLQLLWSAGLGAACDSRAAGTFDEFRIQ